MTHDASRLTGAILAGGASRRFGGQDKGALVLGRGTVFERQLAALRAAVGSILVVTNDPTRQVPPDVRCVGDAIRGAGSLGGVFTAVRAASTPWIVVIACDMPFVSAAFLAYLGAVAEAADVDAVVPRTTDGLLQPLCAVYARTIADVAARQIERGSLKLRDLLRHLRVREIGSQDIAAYDEGNRLFFNINSPEDYRRALEIVQMQQ